MRKTLLLLALAAVLVQPSFAAAENATTKPQYATIDVIKVMQSYKKSQDAQKWNETQEKAIKDFIVDARKKVEAAPAKDQKKLEEKYSKELAQKLDALRKNKDAKVKQISNDVDKAIERVAKKSSYDLILPANSVLYGSVDITSKVIAELKKAK